MQGLPERFLLIKHAEPGDNNEIISINGQLNPMVQIGPGEMQFWRIANIGATLFIKFQIEGMPLYVVATDGHPLSRPTRMTEFFVGPGQRIDAIAIGPQAGEYAMRTISFQNQAWRKPDPAQQLATIALRRIAAARASAETEVLRQRVRARVDRRGAVRPDRSPPDADIFEHPDRRVFMIDGRVMEEDRVDQTVKLGDTEEWTIVNTDQQYHSFHIHQTGFLVTEINGVRQNENSLRDTFSMPPATDAGPGVLKVVIPFTDPVIVGRFVYHCHAVDHEDKGNDGRRRGRAVSSAPSQPWLAQHSVVFCLWAGRAAGRRDPPTMSRTRRTRGGDDSVLRSCEFAAPRDTVTRQEFGAGQTRSPLNRYVRLSPINRGDRNCHHGCPPRRSGR